MSKTKKIISVVLAVALVMAMATVAMVTAAASTKVYFEDSYGWGEVYAYCYGGDGEMFGTWPGSLCTDEGNGVWSIEMTGTPEAVIFNNNAGSQTSNIMYEGTGKIAKLTGNQVQGDYQMVDEAVWEDYAEAPVETTEAAPVETTVAAPVETTVAAPVETTAAAPVETTVAAPVETTAAIVETEATDATEAPVATEDEPATDDEPVVDPVETTAAVEETTVAEVETTVAEVETTVAEVETTVAEVETTVAAADAIVVGGVEYTAKVGDIITYTANLTTPKNIENVQAYTTYDAAKLKLVDATAAERFPSMTGVVANAADGVVYFNASEISAGFDFTAGQTLIYLQFEVLDASYSEIATVIEEMVEFFGGDYVTGGEIVADGVVLAETLEVPVVDETTTAAPEETTVVVPTETDAQSTKDEENKPGTDTVPTGVAATIYVVLAVLAMAAAAVVVLRKKVNG